MDLFSHFFFLSSFRKHTFMDTLPRSHGSCFWGWLNHVKIPHFGEFPWKSQCFSPRSKVFVSFPISWSSIIAAIMFPSPLYWTPPYENHGLVGDLYSVYSFGTMQWGVLKKNGAWDCFPITQMIVTLWQFNRSFFGQSPFLGAKSLINCHSAISWVEIPRSKFPSVERWLLSGHLWTWRSPLWVGRQAQRGHLKRKRPDWGR